MALAQDKVSPSQHRGHWGWIVLWSGAVLSTAGYWVASLAPPTSCQKQQRRGRPWGLSTTLRALRRPWEQAGSLGQPLLACWPHTFWPCAAGLVISGPQVTVCEMGV